MLNFDEQRFLRIQSGAVGLREAAGPGDRRLPGRRCRKHPFPRNGRRGDPDAAGSSIAASAARGFLSLSTCRRSWS